MFAWFQSLQSARLIGWPTFGPTSTWGWVEDPEPHPAAATTMAIKTAAQARARGLLVWLGATALAVS